MNAKDFTDELDVLLTDNDDGDAIAAWTSTFEDAGMLTHNHGLIVRLPNGDEFQLTVVQSRQAGDA